MTSSILTDYYTFLKEDVVKPYATYDKARYLGHQKHAYWLLSREVTIVYTLHIVPYRETTNSQPIYFVFFKGNNFFLPRMVRRSFYIWVSPGIKVTLQLIDSSILPNCDQISTPLMIDINIILFSIQLHISDKKVLLPSQKQCFVSQPELFQYETILLPHLLNGETLKTVCQRCVKLIMSLKLHALLLWSRTIRTLIVIALFSDLFSYQITLALIKFPFC